MKVKITEKTMLIEKEKKNFKVQKQTNKEIKQKELCVWFFIYLIRKKNHLSFTKVNHVRHLMNWIFHAREVELVQCIGKQV